MSLLQTLIHPVPEADRQDTSLRYTDLLFGFVVRELFIRLQNWPDLGTTARHQLIAATLMVLGSWIGYRRSLNRSTYAVKFFNLPFWKFVIDQLMLVLYFRLAVQTPMSPSTPHDPSALVVHTASLVALVFVLYVAWDLLSIWMARATSTENGRARPRYPTIDRATNELTSTRQHIDGVGFSITVAGAVAAGLVWSAGDRGWVLPALIALLLGYRWAKEARTSWQETHHA
jgi:hypothetical protein